MQPMFKELSQKNKFRVVEFLLNRDGVPVTEIALNLRLNAGQTSRIVSELCNVGIIEKKTCKKNKKCHLKNKSKIKKLIFLAKSFAD